MSAGRLAAPGIMDRVTVEIGTYHQEDGQEITRCPSGYAADWEKLSLVGGDYPVRLTFEGGFTFPMPYWLLIGIDSVRIGGETFTGFAGNPHGSHSLPRGEEVRYTIQTYTYTAEGMVKEGRLTLKPEFEWLLTGRTTDGPRTWDEVRTLAEGVSA